ncbi:hypothetical protein [Marivirga lumbricoides]
MSFSGSLKNANVKWIVFGTIVLFSFLPLLLKFPYRVNIYVTWEGAYRMYLGQIPFKDFGMPLGYGFWIIPFIFFKLFGPYMMTLIKAQAFINFISLIVFRGILKLFKLEEATIFFCILIMCLSFTLINFWPWYNHTVFFFELLAIYFVLLYIKRSSKFYWLVLSAFFVWLALLTKQDGGALSTLFVFSLLVIDFIYTRTWKPLLILIGSFALFYIVLVLPFLQYDFTYWFNYGQSPHYSRVNSYHFINDIFTQSQWLKAYILSIMLIVFYKINNVGIKVLLKDKNFILFALFTIGIIIQAIIIQVTSFSPPTVNFYFHSFAIAFIFYNLQSSIRFNNVVVFVAVSGLIFFWKSDNYWKYSQPIISKLAPSLLAPPPSDVVAKGNWAAKSDSVVKTEPVIWVESDMRSLKGIKIPKDTKEGLTYIKKLDIVNKGNLKVLNMSNLTFLAHELNYEPPSGENFPLWFHKGVAVFDREINMLCQKVQNSEYDLILFEDMPDVDNFFPYEVRDCLFPNYIQATKFLSPTGYKTDSVEVYIKK